MLKRWARPLASYVLRLSLWWRVAREIEFVSSPTGRNGLLRSILYAPVSSSRDLSKFQNLELLEDATVRVKGIGLFNVRAHTDDLYVVLPSSERTILDVIRRSLAPGDVFVDAGANIGIYTVVASRIVGPRGSVLAVEMMPQTFERLHGHVELNGCDNVTLVNKAIADHAGLVVEARMPAGGRHGKASIVTADDEEDGETVKVETTTLEDLLSNLPPVRLMKMDLEGAESLAIQGAGAALERVQTIIFESWDEQHDASAVLQARGFRIRRLDGRNLIAENPRQSSPPLSPSSP